jgi:hypothetical protein
MGQQGRGRRFNLIQSLSLGLLLSFILVLGRSPSVEAFDFGLSNLFGLGEESGKYIFIYDMII